MLLRRYQRNDKLDLTEEKEQLDEQGLEQEQPGDVRDETDVTVTKSVDEMTVAEMKEEAKNRELSGYSRMDKDELIALLKGE
jgi:hypothetical protein